MGGDELELDTNTYPSVKDGVSSIEVCRFRDDARSGAKLSACVLAIDGRCVLYAELAWKSENGSSAILGAGGRF